MIPKNNCTKQYILDLADKYNISPTLMCKNIFVLYTLDAMTTVKLPFILKGGTALLFLSNHLFRVTQDIDITVDSSVPLDDYINKIRNEYKCLRFEEEHRPKYSQVPKRHFKVWFFSPIDATEQFIFLDIVLKHTPYAKLIQVPMKCDLIEFSNPVSFVTVPDTNSIVGEKLVAAISTRLGIRLDPIIGYGTIKHIYDCAFLFDNCDNFNLVYNTFIDIAKSQPLYYGFNLNPEELLLSLVQACLCIIGRGYIKSKDYELYSYGIVKVQETQFVKNQPEQEASARACIVLYMAACVLMKDEEAFLKKDLTEIIPITFMDVSVLDYINNYSTRAYCYLSNGISLLEAYLKKHKTVM